MLPLAIIALPGLLCVVQPVAPPQPNDNRRTIVLHVRAATPDGKSVGGIPLLARVEDKDQGRGRVLPDGTCDLSLSVPNESRELALFVSEGPKLPGESLDAMKARLAEFRGLLNKYQLPSALQVQLSPDLREYAAVLTFVPAISVSGRAVNRAGEPVKVSVTHEKPAWPADSTVDGRFEIGGVPQSTPSVIYIFDEHVVVPVDIRPPLARTDLGDIVVQSPPCDATAQITMDFGERKLGSGNATWVLLVSSEGKVALKTSVHVGYEREFEAWVRERDTLEIPAGTYYISRALPLDDVPLKLIRLARSGKDLSATRIPRFTVTAGQHIVIPFDPAVATPAIQSEALDSGK